MVRTGRKYFIYWLCGLTGLFSFSPLGAKTKEVPPWNLLWGRYGTSVVSDGTSLYVVAGGSASSILADIEKIDLATGRSTKLPVQVMPRRFHAAVLVGREILIMGGEALEGILQSVEAVNIDTLKVRKVTSMPTPRRTPGVVLVEDLIFTLGGMAPDDGENLPRSTVMEVYEPAKNKWFRAPPMPRSKEVAAVLNGQYIYTLGGYDGRGKASPTCERYDLSAGKWSSMPPVPFRLSAYSAVSLGDCIICFGDYENKGQVVAYLPDKERWVSLDLPFTPRRHSAACVVGDQVYVVGGNVDSSFTSLSVIERFPVRELREAVARGTAK